MDQVGFLVVRFEFFAVRGEIGEGECPVFRLEWDLEVFVEGDEQGVVAYSR